MNHQRRLVRDGLNGRENHAEEAAFSAMPLAISMRARASTPPGLQQR